MSQTILVVDDEPSVRDLLTYNLRKAGYAVLTAADGHEALEAACHDNPDLILLDLMLPGVDGLEVCRELRKTRDVPIIMVTALGEEIDRVVGLELGADDYVTKPFSVREMLARIKAVLRRAAQPGEKAAAAEASADQAAPETVLTGKGGLRLVVESRQVAATDTMNPGSARTDLADAGPEATTIHLTQLEFDLLHLLLSNAGRVLTREQLLEKVWGYDFAGDTRAVDSAVKRLRAKLRAAHPDADSIEAVRGVGYRFNR